MTQELVIVGTPQYPLGGILTLPDNTAQPVPAVVFVHGSGSSNMDEKVGALTPFKDLAEGLAKHGIASLRYDKRTYKYGFKMVRKGGITVKEETIEDAILAKNLLENDSRIDKNRIFIVGHSMGGMLAPRIDAEGGDFRGLILLAGSPRTLRQILHVQTSQMVEGSKGIKKWIMKKQVRKIMAGFDNFDSISDEEAAERKFGAGVTMYYFKEMEAHPTEKYLAETDKPMLIMQGSKDFQCTTALDFMKYKELLSGRDNVTFKLYDDLNHCFVPAIYDSIAAGAKEYKTERHIGENVIKDIADWIKEA